MSKTSRTRHDLRGSPRLWRYAAIKTSALHSGVPGKPKYKACKTRKFEQHWFHTQYERRGFEITNGRCRAKGVDAAPGYTIFYDLEPMPKNPMPNFFSAVAERDVSTVRGSSNTSVAMGGTELMGPACVLDGSVAKRCTAQDV